MSRRDSQIVAVDPSETIPEIPPKETVPPHSPAATSRPLTGARRAVGRTVVMMAHVCRADCCHVHRPMQANLEQMDSLNCACNAGAKDSSSKDIDPLRAETI